MHKPFLPPQTIIVKIGTASLSQPDGLPNFEVLRPLARQLVTLKNQGHRVALVSSGAVGFGRHFLGWPKPLDEDQKGVASMVGQTYLMQTYSALFMDHGFLPAAQGLLQNANLSNGPTPARQFILSLLQKVFDTPRLIPVLNENDFASGAELAPLNPNDPDTYSDNDGLASLVARMLSANKMVTISTHCLHTKNPCVVGSRVVPYVNLSSTSYSLEALNISTEGTSCGGTGGMGNKIKMAQAFIQSGGICGHKQAHIIAANTVAADGILRAVRGEIVGTKIVCAVGQKQREWRMRNLSLKAAACCAYEF